MSNVFFLFHFFMFQILRRRRQSEPYGAADESSLCYSGGRSRGHGSLDAQVGAYHPSLTYRRKLDRRHFPRRRCQAMFHRIPMQIVKVGLQIFRRPAAVFPKTPLPNATFLPLHPRGRHPALALAGREKTVRELPFDSRPPSGIVAVAKGKRADRVQVIRQHHDSVQLKGKPPADDAERLSQSDQARGWGGIGASTGGLNPPPASESGGSHLAGPPTN